MTKCASCGAEIEWCVAKSGKRIPVDVAPAPDGNLVVWLGQAMKRTPEHDARGITPRRAHFATCPQADLWRRKK